ncbi:hypothetical protein TRIUR3_05080 [Triticum urartu]|uniref:Uncharacterized protein n=1 Tax=Triticum urartu TaxID=4572 RepID=M7Z4B2_TRIUA|nr:hypothetical protein TRIUR3_05080 [Triticum urartu]
MSKSELAASFDPEMVILGRRRPDGIDRASEWPLVGCIGGAPECLPSMCQWFRLYVLHLVELMKGVNQGEGSSAYDMALIQAQIRHLAQEVRDLTLSKPITILSGKSDSGGSLSSYILPAAAVGALGYCYMWCKKSLGNHTFCVCVDPTGWSLSDVMFVTKRNMASAVDSMSKQLEQVSSALAATKRHLTKRLENLDGKMDEQVEVSKQIRNENSNNSSSVFILASPNQYL